MLSVCKQNSFCCISLVLFKIFWFQHILEDRFWFTVPEILRENVEYLNVFLNHAWIRISCWQTPLLPLSLFLIVHSLHQTDDRNFLVIFLSFTCIMFYFIVLVTRCSIMPHWDSSSGTGFLLLLRAVRNLVFPHVASPAYLMLDVTFLFQRI